jgi:hypothetical protein
MISFEFLMTSLVVVVTQSTELKPLQYISC